MSKKKNLRPLQNKTESETANRVLAQMNIDSDEQIEDNIDEKVKSVEDVKRKQDEERNVGLSVLIPASLREDINVLCKLHDTKLAAECRRLLEEGIEEERDKIESYKKLMQKI